jgi:hypothetical protein
MVLAHALAHRGAGLGLGQHALAGAIAFGALAIVKRRAAPDSRREVRR